VKLIVQLKLVTTPEDHAALLETLERANDAANAISETAWETRTFGQFALQKATYYVTKARFGLTAQLAVRVTSKVVDAYKLDRKVRRVFRRRGSIAYDDRILRYKEDCVSIWTIHGRRRIPFVCDDRARRMLTHRQGESDLVLRDGAWYLFATVNVEDPPVAEPEGFLGIDLGIKNIAVDSDGTVYAGRKLRRYRKRCRRIRRRLQALGTRGARRLLVMRRRKERRHATHVNHCIAKKIARKAVGTGRGVAVEDLTGIRDRKTVRRADRDEHSGWAFHQLRAFLDYKCAAAGVPFVAVDARNTSRTCPACGSVDKRNRRSQSEFRCIQCALEGHADVFAALEIARRATVSWPNCRAGDGPLDRTPKCAIGKATPLGVSAMPPALAAG
jgi:IS605 OrfB family transposase